MRFYLFIFVQFACRLFLHCAGCCWWIMIITHLFPYIAYHIPSTYCISTLVDFYGTCRGQYRYHTWMLCVFHGSFLELELFTAQVASDSTNHHGMIRHALVTPLDIQGEYTWRIIPVSKWSISMVIARSSPGLFPFQTAVSWLIIGSY